MNPSRFNQQASCFHWSRTAVELCEQLVLNVQYSAAAFWALTLLHEHMTLSVTETLPGESTASWKKLKGTESY